MNMEYKQWLTYWKKGLSDSLTTDIDITRIETSRYFEIENFKMESQVISNLEKVNELINLEEKRRNDNRGIADKNSENWIPLKELQIIISPLKLVSLEAQTSKFPFWFFTQIDREGKLQMPKETVPIFQRKYLEPVADERTEFVFGSVEDIDQATSIRQEEYENYLEYITYLKNVFKKAVDQEIESYSIEGHKTVHNAIILLPNEDMSAAIGIIELYEQILKEENIPPLLKSFITLQNENQKLSLAVPDLINANSSHLGQMGFDFPASLSQRKSLYTYLQANDKVFAINGPPGTGKTTLLQNIVANKFVESALLGNDAPIILACSTNNQAVTNIIDSFSKSNTKTGKLQGRWLPDIEGYATYLPAKSKTEAELEGINYQKQNGEGLFKKVENYNFLQKAKVFFIEKSAAYFGAQIDIKKATEKLQKEIVQIQSVLKDALLKWNEYLKAEELFSTKYLISTPNAEKYYDNSILNEISFQADVANLHGIEEKIIRYFNNEPLFRRLFCFFDVKWALNNRASELRIILRDSLIEVLSEFVFTKSNILEQLDAKIKMAKIIIEKIDNWKNWKTQNSIKGNPPRTEQEYLDFELQKSQTNSEPNCFYDELDVSHRHKSFQLALHYWEGKYLIKLEQDLSDGNFNRKGLEPTKNRWKRQAMLTPCFVSTFYMSPKFFKSFKFLQEGENGKKMYAPLPLFGFIDLLIVDEAGQTSPEVGVATFALAKQAIIVGDVKQIEPIWKITRKNDIGNLKKCELIKEYDDLIYEGEFNPKGFLSATGSLMKMAQNACSFKEKEIAEKGMLLVEHRRCYDEIINYCNVLAYHGQLIPLRGAAQNDLLFPPMYCIHVEGNSTTLNTTSRHNQNEVQAIVDWLLKNKERIEKKYNKIEKAVGILTPFAGQKNKLRAALEKAGFNTAALKIGTVHALQGAERPIVLFSMVYGQGDSGMMFFDRDNKPNMLNVAVSRAQDNFIVFANTKILNKNAKTPSGILSNYLTYETENSIV